MFISKHFSKVILILLIFSFPIFAQVNFTAFDTSNSILPTNKISRLVKNVNGDILVGTGLGLFKYRDNKITKIYDGSSLYFTTDIKGNIWFGKNNYFSKYDGVKWSDIDSGQTCFSHINTFVVYGDGLKWVYTENGLTLYKDSVMCQVFTPEQIGVDPGYFIQIFLSSDEIFWCAGEPYLRSNVPAGLAKTDGTKWITRKNTFKFSIDETNHIVWGISWDTLEKINYDDLSTIATYPRMGPTYIFADHEDNVWTGDIHGLYRFNSVTEKWETYDISLDSFGINSMAEDNNGNLFIGTAYNGLVVIDLSKITDVRKFKTKIIKDLHLAQNYPNPFNSSSLIKFTIPSTSMTKLIITDILGRTVKILVNDVYKPGEYSIRYDLNNLPSGIYLYTLITDANSISKKMILLK